jgi:acetyl-CoA carboxylase beta subunit
MTQVSRVVRDLGVSGDVSGARLVLSTPTAGGAFAAYASIIDAGTNDPRTLLPR